MVRTLIQLMRTLDKMPEEVLIFDVVTFIKSFHLHLIWLLFQRTILMKLHYYDDVTV